MSKNSHDFVNVSVRIKPNFTENNSTCVKVISQDPPILLVPERSATYNFDHIFADDVDQKEIYDVTVKPLVEQVKAGYNCTVFTYGQTGTGKTYTMGTDAQVQNVSDRGLIPRTLDDLFYPSEDYEVEISVSFIEIYNEKVFDLLDNTNKLPLTVKGFKVCMFNQERVFNSHEAKHFLEMGNRNRHTGETKQNANSSRSHAIFTIHCSTKTATAETRAKLNLVDLAGCESVKKTGTHGSSFHEGVNINKGLLCIGQVMSALSSNSSFIPYRQSIITTILQDSLNKKNYVSLIACLSPNPEDCNETVQTLEFAYRVKKIKNKPEVNDVVSKYKKENPLLFPSRTLQTPFKRPNTTPLQSTVKRSKNFQHLSTVPEIYTNSTAIESPQRSLFSMSVSSIASDATQHHFSPVIRKYISQMESSLVNRLETVIVNTLKRPTRKSMRLLDNLNKENTPLGSPKYSWSQIQSEVSKLVKAEIQQFTVSGTRAASSPILSEVRTIRRILSYDSPILTGENSMLDFAPLEDNSVFKIPKGPIVKKLKDNQSMLVPIRRSTRLSIKQKTLNSTNVTFNGTNSSPIGRRSVRLSMKKRQSPKTPATVKKAPRRLKKGKNTPKTTHKHHVLGILNEGMVKQLEKLHSIGPKTAEQIYTYRQLKGSFHTFEDMIQIPGWTQKKLDKFIEQNFLSL